MDAATIRRFADGELFVRIDRNARGRDVFIFQSTNAPAENMMELLLLIDAAKRASAARVTAVVPYFGYGRQDRKDQPRISIGAKLMANIIVAAGADRVVSIDFHQHQITGLLRHPRRPPLCRSGLHALHPGKGARGSGRSGAGRGIGEDGARPTRSRLGAMFAIIDKRRPAPNASEVMSVVGDVKDKTCILTDDMVDTGGTVANAVHALVERGASKVYGVASHALLSGPAVERLSAAPLEEFVVTDTIHIPEERRFPQLTVLSVDELLADAIRFIHSNESVSALFEIRETD